MDETNERKKRKLPSLKIVSTEHTKFLNDDGSIRLDGNETPITHNWVKSKFNLDTTYVQLLRTMAETQVYFAIYAIIAFLFIDEGKLPMDAAMQAFFLPLFMYLMASFRDFSKLIRAFILSALSIYLIFIPMYEANLITHDGIVLIKYFLPLIKLAVPEAVGDITNADSESLQEILGGAIVVTIFFELFLFIIVKIFKRKGKVQFVITDKAIYIKAKSKNTTWEIIKKVFFIVLGPFNVANYRDIRNLLQYRALTKEEWDNHDLGLIYLCDIEEIEIKPLRTKKKLSIVIILLIITLLSGPLVPIFGLLFLIVLITYIRGKDKADIKIHYNQFNVQGSWRYTNNADKIILRKMGFDISLKFEEIQKSCN